MNITAIIAQSLTDNLPHVDTGANSHYIKDVLSLMFGLAGALAFLMIVISGFRYVIAQDDAQKVTQAKKGVIYSLVGLIIAASGEIIVGYVLGNVHP